MTGLKLFLARMNGWALSLLLHGGVALLAGVSVFTTYIGGGSGRGSGASGISLTPSFAATLRDGNEQILSGAVLPDTAHYGRLTEDTVPEPIAEEIPIPPVLFDVFAVGSEEPAPVAPAFLDPLQSRPGAVEGRTTKLPAPSASSDEGSGGSSDGDDDGNGEGDGSGDGEATGVYTPAPAYPKEARRRNIEGSVLVELAIASDGTCALQRIVESSGYRPLDDAVQNAVTHWKYRSSDEDGRPDTTTKRIRFTFKLGR